MFFLIEYESQVENLKPFIISLIKQRILSFDEGLNILKIDNEDLKQELEFSNKENQNTI